MEGSILQLQRPLYCEIAKTAAEMGIKLSVASQKKYIKHTYTECGFGPNTTA